MNILLKKYSDTDYDFIKDLFFNCKCEEMKVDAPNNLFLNNIINAQFKAQNKFYANLGDSADHYIIMADQTKVGRLIKTDDQVNLHIADITISPGHRKRGIAGNVLKSLIRSANENGKTISLRVNKANPLVGYYSRLGFDVIADEGIRYLMAYKSPE